MQMLCAKEINGCDRACEKKVELFQQGVGGVMASPEDLFYDKLAKLNEATGLSLLINFRQTSFGLYKFYQEVTVRGGYHQVTKDKKWGEIASSINPKGGMTLLSDQLHKIYGNLLYPFEQIHHYRASAKVPASVDSVSGNALSGGDCLSCSNRKRKRSNNPPVSIICCGPLELASSKKKHNSNKSSVEARVRSRSAYQLFLKKECERLKSIHGESSESKNTLDVAIKAWEKLPMEKRKVREHQSSYFYTRNESFLVYKSLPLKIPYMEEAKKEKEKFNHETKTHNEKKNSLSCSKIVWPISDGDYRVTVQPAPTNINVPNETIKLMKNKLVNNTVFQINLEEL